MKIFIIMTVSLLLSLPTFAYTEEGKKTVKFCDNQEGEQIELFSQSSTNVGRNGFKRHFIEIKGLKIILKLENDGVSGNIGDDNKYTLGPIQKDVENDLYHKDTAINRAIFKFENDKVSIHILPRASQVNEISSDNIIATLNCKPEISVLKRGDPLPNKIVRTKFALTKDHQLIYDKNHLAKHKLLGRNDLIVSAGYLSIKKKGDTFFIELDNESGYYCPSFKSLSLVSALFTGKTDIKLYNRPNKRECSPLDEIKFAYIFKDVNWISSEPFNFSSRRIKMAELIFRPLTKLDDLKKFITKTVFENELVDSDEKKFNKIIEILQKNSTHLSYIKVESKALRTTQLGITDHLNQTYLMGLNIE